MPSAFAVQSPKGAGGVSVSDYQKDDLRSQALSLEQPLQLPTCCRPFADAFVLGYRAYVEQRDLTPCLERDSHANKQEWQGGGGVLAVLCHLEGLFD